MEYIVDQLDQSPLVHTRSMFGEYALYYDGIVVGFICDNTMFLKINPATVEILGENHEKGPAYPGSKDYYVLGDDVLEDKELFVRLVRVCEDNVKKIKRQ